MQIKTLQKVSKKTKLMKNETQTLKELLETMGTAERVNRKRVSNFVLENKELFPVLLKIVFETSYKLHYKAAWTLEFVLKDNLEWLVPHLDFFTNNIQILSHQSAIRPISKICKWLAISYVKKENQYFVKTINQKHLDKLVETGFDWLIGEHKVAAKAYTMESLYLFGKLQKRDLEWVHIELRNIITQNIINGSPAYKTQGKMILKLLK